MDRRTVTVLLAIAALLLGAVPAGAAALEVRTTQRTYENPKGPPSVVDEHTVAFTAAPGEANRPRASLAPDGTVVVIDEGAPLTAGVRCRQVGEREVHCSAPSRPVLMTLDLGDGDDEVAAGAIAGLPPAVSGGPGADRIATGGTADGGEGDDQLTGGPGSDSLKGGPGADLLDSGDGSDSLDGGPGRDVLRAGAGDDTVSWTGETAPVTVDLAAGGPAGTAAEPDELSGAEAINGGAGDDVLRGTEATDRLTGGPGDDRLEGRGGDDDLRGETGNDTVEGGDGDDQVEAPAASRRVDGGAGDDVVEMGGFGYRPNRATWRRLELGCGRGSDAVSGLEVPAVYPRDCEVAILDPGGDELPMSTRLRRSRGRLRVPIPANCEGCPTRLELRDDRGRRLARRRIDPRRASVAFRIDRRLRRALRRPAIEIRFGFGLERYRLMLLPPRR